MFENLGNLLLYCQILEIITQLNTLNRYWMGTLCARPTFHFYASIFETWHYLGSYWLRVILWPRLMVQAQCVLISIIFFSSVNTVCLCMYGCFGLVVSFYYVWKVVGLSIIQVNNENYILPCVELCQDYVHCHTKKRTASFSQISMNCILLPWLTVCDPNSIARFR